jgi:prepilin-type N-terminal cleavage/methylation domain-containing protein
LLKNERRLVQVSRLEPALLFSYLKMYFEKIDLRNEKGFTLIEIFAVLVILGIFAAAAVQKYLNVAHSARQRAAGS